MVQGIRKPRVKLFLSGLDPIGLPVVARGIGIPLQPTCPPCAGVPRESVIWSEFGCAYGVCYAFLPVAPRRGDASEAKMCVCNFVGPRKCLERYGAGLVGFSQREQLQAVP